ncbi:hypothetical protein ACFOWX_08325 [Sphingorhabdus arenilitoris]|uniref:Uncharacterized protein n=1 Tax=Sphingorhabdus arenilitoris TaxID=1490041 RepID=A0ABV8RIU2_9SPHN
MTWNGRTAEVVAVGFRTDQTNTRFIIPDDFEYDTDVFSLPNLRGYGELWEVANDNRDIAHKGSTLSQSGWIDSKGKAA